MYKNIKPSAIAIHMPLIDHFLGKHWFFDLVLRIYWRDLKGSNPKIIATKSQNIWVCLKMVSTPKPNGFADHYPY